MGETSSFGRPKARGQGPRTRRLTVLAGALLLSQSAFGASEISSSNGHKVLRVDGLPHFNLSVDLQESKTGLPGGACNEVTIDDYLDWAKEVGANAVTSRWRWKTWVDCPEPAGCFGGVFQPLSPDQPQIRALLQGAWERGLKVNVVWIGSSANGDASFPPVAIDAFTGTYSDKVDGGGQPISDYHPDDEYMPGVTYGDLCSPTDDLLGCPIHSVVTKDDGLVAGTGSSGATTGVMCPDWPSTLEVEKAALVEMVTWLKDEKPVGGRQDETFLDTVISLNLQNEIFMGSEAGETSTDRCHCHISDHFFDPGNRNSTPVGFESFGSYNAWRDNHPNKPLPDDAERYNQFTLQRYISYLSDAVHAIPAAKDLPIVLNVLGEPPTPPSGSPAADIDGWLAFGNVDMLGPDMYGWDVHVYEPMEFDKPDNLLYAPEIGSQFDPAFQVFGAFGSNLATNGPWRAFVGSGYGVHTLLGDPFGDFQGMLNDGCLGTAGQWFGGIRSAYYHRNSMTAIRSASALLTAHQTEAGAADEDRLVAFFDRVYTGLSNDTFPGATAQRMGDADGVTIDLIDRGSIVTPARGAIVRIAPRDWTIVGVSYDVEISGTPAQLSDLIVERGYWAGTTWKSLGVATHFPTATKLTIPMDADNTTATGALDLVSTEHNCSALACQYVVRVYPPPVAPVFADDFESGDTSAWDTKQGDVDATMPAALEGVYGLKVTKSISPTPRQRLLYNYDGQNPPGEYRGSFLFELDNYPVIDPGEEQNFRQVIFQVQGLNPAPDNDDETPCSSAPYMAAGRIFLYMTGGQGQNPNIQLWGRGNQCGERGTPRIPFNAVEGEPIRVCFQIKLGGGLQGELAVKVQHDGGACPDVYDPGEWATVPISNGLLGGFYQARLGINQHGYYPDLNETGTMYFDDFESYDTLLPPLEIGP